MGGTERVQRQHDSGRLTVRERLATALDAGSFTEIGGLAGQAAYDADGQLTDVRASNVLIGTATVARRPIRRDLQDAEDPAALRTEIHARMEAVRSPLRTAEVFGIERIVDPAETRAILTDWILGAYRVLAHDLGPTARGLRP